MEVADQGNPVEQAATPGDGIRSLIHRLNNHLTLVVGYGQLLLDEANDRDVKKGVTLIVSEAEKASQVARDLLSLVRSSGPISG